MDYLKIVVVFFGGLIITLLCNFDIMFTGSVHDGYFSDKVIEKMTVKENSILRKMMPFFNESNNSMRKFIYIRIIPLLILIVIAIISILLFFIDQMIYDFLIDDVFFFIGGGIALIDVVYRFVIAILSRIL